MVDIDFLKSVELFFYIEDQYLQHILPLIKVAEYNDGDEIFAEGTDPDNLYIIKQGEVKIVKQIVAEEIKILATLKPGGFFGELSIFDCEPRSASAVAYGEDKIIIYYISKTDLVNFNTTSPYIMNLVMQNIIITLSKRMRKVNEQLRDKVFWGFVTKK